MSRQSPRGFLIIELLFVLGMLGVFALLMTRVFYSSFGIMHKAGFAQRDALRFDAATAALRHDVGNATQISVISPAELSINQADGSTVQWSANRNALIRTAGGTPQQWMLGEPISFAARGGLMLLCPGHGGDASAVSIPFASQRQILQTIGGR